MSRFRYRALDGQGRIVTGLVEVASARDAVAQLRLRGHLPIRVAPADRWAGFLELLNRDITPRAVLPPRDRVVLTQAIATLIEAGVPLDRCLEMVGELGETPAVRRNALRLLERVTGGASLADAMDAEGPAFPPIYRGVVRAAEASATLGPVLARLVVSEETAAKRRAALRSALIYPVFLCTTAAICVGVLLIFVVPTFEPMLIEAGAALPLSTRIVLASARFVGAAWPLLLVGCLAIALGAQMALARPAIRERWHRTLLRLPLVGPLRRKLGSAALARVLGELLAGGVALPTALRLALGGLDDAAFSAELARATPRIEAGQGLGRAFAEGRVVAPLAVHLMEVGERSGKLAAMLTKSADILDEGAKTTLDRAMTLLTPVVTLVMGGIIALIISSILFALFSLNDLATGGP